VTRPAVPDRFLLKCTSICWIGTAIGTRRTGPRSTARGRTPPDNGEWRLTIAEKRRILLTHIYGVDIDPQAVEVTKLSLLLKVLENEKADIIAAQMNFFHLRFAGPG
jgi:hypothetical protein